MAFSVPLPESAQAQAADCIPGTTTDSVWRALTSQLPLCMPAEARVPCFSGICLADNIASKSSAVSWTDYWPEIQRQFLEGSSDTVTLDSAKPPKKASQEPLRIRDTPRTRAAIEFAQNQVIGLPPTETKLLALYIAAGRADRRILEIFDKYKPTVCRRLNLSATFRSENGHPTAAVLQATEPGRLIAFRISRGFEYGTTDELSQQETRNAVRAAHPMVFHFRNNPQMPAYFRIGNHIIKATGTIGEAEIPSVTYELHPKTEDPSAIDTFENAAQPGCRAKPQSLD